MAVSRVRTIVSTKWLRDQLSCNVKRASRRLRVLDTTFYPNQQDDSRKEYFRNHIPQSVFFDLHHCVKSTTAIPRNLPDPKCFENYVQTLGVWPDTHVITYDRYGPSSAYRTWWLFRLFGHHNISILDGGYNKWLRDGFEVTTEVPNVEHSNFTASIDLSMFRSYEQMVENVDSFKEQVVDARSPGSKSVTEGNDGGTIPQCKHVPFDQLFNDDGTIKSESDLQSMFLEAGVYLNRPMVATCLTGMTACGIAVAAHILGKQVPVYYGSWTEWRQRAPDEYKRRTL